MNGTGNQEDGGYGDGFGRYARQYDSFNFQEHVKFI
jgi:hypothetical protein